MNQTLMIDPNQFQHSRGPIRGPSYLRVEPSLPGNMSLRQTPQLLLQPQLYLHPPLGNGTGTPHTLNGYTTDPSRLPTNNNR